MAKLRIAHIAIAVLFVLSTMLPLLLYHFSFPDDNGNDLRRRVAFLEKQICHLAEKSRHYRLTPTPKTCYRGNEMIRLRYENVASLQIFSDLSPRQRRQLAQILRQARQLAASHRHLDMMRFELYLRERIQEQLTHTQRLAYYNYLQKQQLGF